MQEQLKLSALENHFPDIDYSDIVLLHNGHEKCAPNKVNGPHVCDHYLFHLIVSGLGVLTLGGLSYPLHAGQGFLITPGQLFQYAADENDPWEYLWLGFKGESVRAILYSSHLLHTSPIYMSARWLELRAYMLDGIEAVHRGSMGAAVRCQGLLYMALSHLLEETPQLLNAHDVTKLTSVQLGYINSAIDFIRENISARFTASAVAAHLGLNRSYFSRLFSNVCGKSPTKFIYNYRLDLAWHMVRHSSAPIGYIARATGFDDAAYFTRRFTARYGQPPRQVRAGGNIRPIA